MLLSNVDQLTLKFSKSNQGPGEGDTTDEGPQEQEGLDDIGSWVSGKVRLLQHVIGKTGQHCSGTNKTVEEGHHLGQVSDLHTLGHHSSNQSTFLQQQKITHFKLF